ncbi:MAG: hypothetical protein HZA54_15835 [Planctomycetes bacterium]|nr:hypothetical protein [Planctomycetota bacterium]
MDQPCDPSSAPSPPTLEAVLRQPPRGPFFLEMDTPLGRLRLDLAGPPDGILASPRMTDDQVAAAEAEWQRARALYQPGAHAASEQAMREIVSRYPLWGKGHGALYDLHRFLEQWAEAEYHLKQLIAVAPTWEHLKLLADLLGPRGRTEEAAVVQEHLWAHRQDAPAESACDVARNFLVTLHRLRRHRRMVELAVAAQEVCGEQPVLVYQQVLGLLRDDQHAAARARFAEFEPRLDPQDPLYGQFLKLKQALAAAP